ncbi:Dihydrodipicolinate synthetase [Pseudomonas coronafaciens pv. zizaniae]|nr:Dihydrodipicolinate synthetase [Pseudomonas coronafaciens pv. atropurpurea]RMM79341.1 Dihydrodipicolinate synthetase [Pseudomonas coronafaciens pv. striafaciens]RMN26855.1 Dihydrodipicolinate synthetase [Pseudomonas coronafaciens pv. zizaniae]RMN34347.1 Dihydrodipicolinate synthetase [Pseudomonas coronafaciens pv. zizaniae]RMP25256.1 Dihydrodipicolinate synthetase [Pseudomonas coronafaciens pv. atropurpurea]
MLYWRDMMSTPSIHGIIGYTITPFTSNGEGIELDALGRSIDRLISGGVHAISPLGSTGEGAYLSDMEWNQVAEYSLSHVAKRVPTIISVSDLTTGNAVRRARFAEAHGADAVMVLPSSYWRLSEQEILQHYQTIGDSVSLPIMLYNNPAVSGTDMPVELILRIFDAVENVTMVKESTGDIQRMHKMHLLGEGRVPFYNGCNPLALEAFAAGAVGWCTAAPNLIADLNGALYKAILGNELRSARELFYRQLPLLDFILKGGLPATIKAGLRMSGLEVGDPRLPVSALSDDACLELRALLANVRQEDVTR